MAKIDKIICPLMKRECIEDGAIVDGEMQACRFWVYVHGKSPQDGAEVKQGDCAFAWTPALLIENSQMQRQTGAAVESFRNEMVKANATGQQMMMSVAGLANGQILKIGGD